MSVGTITSLFRYPVKSMGGETLNAITLGPKGIFGDRAWAVRDEERGGIRGAKRFPELMSCSAKYLEDPAPEGSSPAEITLPDGRQFMTSDQSISERLSELVGSPVSFWPLMPEDALDHYKRGAPLEEDMMKELRRVFAREEDEPLPDVSAFPPELVEYESIPGTYFDAYPLLIMSQQSLDYLSGVKPDSIFDVRRFRPNLLVDAPSNDPFPELSWLGKTLRIGSATFKIELECPRCVMTTHGFDDLPKDPKIMRTLVKDAKGSLGIYANVEAPGTVSVGDTVDIS